MFQPEERREIPTMDLVSYTFSGHSYDHDKPLLISAGKPHKSYSYNESRSVVRKLIAGLTACGLRPGDSICLHAYNNINYPLIYLAVVGAGCRFVGSNPSHGSSELEHLFSICEVKLVIADPEILSSLRVTLSVAGIPHSRVLILRDEVTVNDESEFESWTTLFEHGECEWIRFDDETISKNTVAALMSTSGTTGLPKAAQSSHYAQVAQSVILREERKPYKIIRLLCLPQFHAFNFPLALISPIREGRTTYIMKRYNADELLCYCQQYKISEITMVNPIVFDMLSRADKVKEALSSLRAVYCGGVPLDAAVQNQFNGILHPDAIVSQVYGMTEIFWITSLRFPERDCTGSAGRLLPNVEARIVAENGQDITRDGIRGLILARGPSLMIGYLNISNTCENAIVDGWLETGDIGYQIGGKWYIVDRAKEIIKVRGWQVSPTEIEACLRTHPAIKDAAVIGVDYKDQRGELPRAYVSLEAGLQDTLSETDVQSYVREHLAKYKALDGGVQFCSSIPRSAAGKVDKKFFRAEATREVRTEMGKAAALAVITVGGPLGKDSVKVHESELAAGGVLEAALEAVSLRENSPETAMGDGNCEAEPMR